MKPLTKLAETVLPTGSVLELWERDDSYFLLADGVQTSSSFSHGGDDAIASIAAAPIKRANQPIILIDGLALGFLLKGVMEEINKEKASFIVAEPCSALVGWHETILGDLHPGMLHDPRVTIEPMTSLQAARKASKTYHAILTRSTHSRTQLSIGEASDYCAALKQGGLLVILLSRPDKRLERTLQKAGFDVSIDTVPTSHKGKQTSFQTVMLARKGRFVPFAQRN